MLFMLLVKASHNSENAQLPSPELMAAMDQYNDQLETAGVKIMAKVLHPTRQAFRFRFTKEGQPAEIIQGPFTPSTEQVAGFFLLELSSLEEAYQWALKAPDLQGFGEGEIELRQVY